MRIICKTNLDLRGEVWPNELSAVPRVGEYIRSSTTWKDFQLELQVVAVTWVYVGGWQNELYEWVPQVELHIKRVEGHSIRSFYEWYAPLVGRSVSSFI